jgi:hypothetical protein
MFAEVDGNSNACVLTTKVINSESKMFYCEG